MDHTKNEMYNYNTSGNDVGKNINVSFPFHELHLLNDLDTLAHSNCVNLSAWIRKKIKEDMDKLNVQRSELDRLSHLMGIM